MNNQSLAHPLFSVIITCHNSERFVQEALQSVFEQPAHPSLYEIIAVDDLSTDATPNLLQKYGRNAVAPRLSYYTSGVRARDAGLLRMVK